MMPAIPTSTKETPILLEDDDTYFARPHYWGSTDAKRFHESPQKANDYRTGIVPEPDSAAFAFGRAWDCMQTAPDDFAKRFVVRPAGIDGRTKAGKEWLAEAQASGREVIKQEDADRLDIMANRMPQEIRDRLDTYTVGQAVIRVGHALQSDWMQEPVWYAQGKIDLLLPDCMVDVKTTSNSLENFARSAYNFGYHIQAAWYRRIWLHITQQRMPFHFCVTETQSPFRTAWFTPTYDEKDDLQFYQLGDKIATTIEAGITACYALGSWHDTKPVFQPLSLPAWVRKD